MTEATMRATIKLEDGTTKVLSDLTLVEQTATRVYAENETADEYPTEHRDAELISVQDCKRIGFVKNGNEIYRDNVESAEQVDDNTIEVQFNTGDTETITGDFDRAYTY